MNQSIRLRLSVSCVVLFLSSAAMASTAVRRAEFSKLDGPGADGEWLECSVELEVRHDARDPKRRAPDYVDDLTVELLLGFESASNGRSRFEFYRSEAAPVSLKEGRHRIRFYLPPEVLERDRLGSEAHSFLVRLHRSGTVAGEFVSRQLERSPVKESFLRRSEAEASRNDGILLPQFETVFRSAYPRETPSYRIIERTREE